MQRPDPATTLSEGEKAAEREDTLSAGEVGTADVAAGNLTRPEVVVGEIPAAEEPTTMLWTARCSERSHDLLGHFETREAAETARTEHLETAHGGDTE